MRKWLVGFGLLLAASAWAQNDRNDLRFSPGLFPKPVAKVAKWEQAPTPYAPAKPIFNNPNRNFGTIVNASEFSMYRLPADATTQQWGWFCQKEWQLQQKIKLPLYMRLGNKETVDRFENKLSPR